MRRKLKDVLEDKVECYATEHVKKCTPNGCRFYWTCLSYARQLEICDIESREEILETRCH